MNTRHNVTKVIKSVYAGVSENKVLLIVKSTVVIILLGGTYAYGGF